MRLHEDDDRLSRWDRRTLDLVSQQGLYLVAVACADCKRMRPPQSMVQSRATYEWHCRQYSDECHREIVANHGGMVEA